ncbi:HNH endonuclease [Streptomyces sp. OUCMDZ-4982]|uniref:HNH endonuclease signature motif containing protein n=1 Tax=Streptomyces sp. OUCMDZ-4982 TaxID=2973090 RepID=UPI00215C75FF|nr:HNH endonuclease signature motif containing protein [Streptomyces sp. OUCMDZ-4982]MCR8945174.1 HNH endonuclease [Streptomyces sp. OUCMDZ-4982]
MRRLKPPQIGTLEAFRMCISEKITPSTLAVLRSYELSVVVAAGEYERACRSLTLHQLDPAKFSPDPSKDGHKRALIAMYDQRMKKEQPGRPVYEEARNRKGKCPICGVGRVRQVDHHLPKSIYPFLAAVPINLLPICGDCNREKLDKAPTCYAEQALHPYFDDIESDRWLRAELITINAAGERCEVEPLERAEDWRIEFRVDPPSSWDKQQEERVEHHFSQTYKLDEIYEDQAADDIPGLELALEEVFEVGGAPDVRTHLEGLARTRAHRNKNSWMVALYEALADHSWFCSGGFRQIAAG